MDETRHASSIPTTVLRDNREQRPWTSDGCAVETRDVTLSTGDYAVPIDCTHDSEADTYHPRFAVEHKPGHDFLTALTWDRDRFTSELRRGPMATAPCGRRRGVLANPPSQPGLYEAAERLSEPDRRNALRMDSPLQRRVPFRRVPPTSRTVCVFPPRPSQSATTT